MSATSAALSDSQLSLKSQWPPHGGVAALHTCDCIAAQQLLRAACVSLRTPGVRGQACLLRASLMMSSTLVSPPGLNEQAAEVRLSSLPTTVRHFPEVLGSLASIELVPVQSPPSSDSVDSLQSSPEPPAASPNLGETQPPFAPATTMSESLPCTVVPLEQRPRSHSDPTTAGEPPVRSHRFRRPYKPVMRYFAKWRGQHQPMHKYLSVHDMVWAFIGSFLGILLPAALTFNLLELRLDRTDLTLIVGSFGASAVLLYSSIVSDFAQPRSVFGGHIVSASVGVCVRKMFPIGGVQLDSLACALGVSLAIVAMNLTRTLHPPGGATALIAVLPSSQIQNLGFLYVLIPMASGIGCMLLVALMVNNLPKHRTWPKWWY